jgi:hypothetical protein
VQFASSSGSSTSFDTTVSAPTNGNLLVAITFGSGGFSLGAGWTRLEYNTAGSYYCQVAYKIASSESTTQTPATAGGSTSFANGIWEVNGQNGTIGTAIKAVEARYTASNSLAAYTPMLPQIASTLFLAGISASGAANAFTRTFGAVEDVNITGGSGLKPAYGHCLSSALYYMMVGYFGSDSESLVGWMIVSA